MLSFNNGLVSVKLFEIPYLTNQPLVQHRLAIKISVILPENLNNCAF